MVYFARPLAKLIDALERLPSIGPKSAQRMALHLLRDPEQARQLAAAIQEATQAIKNCPVCFNLTEQEPCSICRDAKREATTLCVVADPRDLMAIENTGEYRGQYHVLQGLLSPVDGVGPEDIRVRELLARLRPGQTKEVILALNPVVEGDATAMYLAKLIKPLGIRTTRLALGLPVGGDLDYADQVTIARALEGRREI